ncbi:hypothetical protein AVEN_203649-1 [Araneus ventricosus]|uniref:Uncharacterized protein n=1 Tax=Araneus ventricosus TaxID=182803 RepID=A0A4Y2JBI4_ARAVE|nr:hypothetical protein AVEN_203649-1 [Araneus ventricosus]
MGCQRNNRQVLFMSPPPGGTPGLVPSREGGDPFWSEHLGVITCFFLCHEFNTASVNLQTILQAKGNEWNFSRRESLIVPMDGWIG